MFIYSVKASTLKFAAIIAVGIAVFTALFVLIPPYENSSGVSEAVSINYDKMKTNDDRRAFLSSLGYEVSDSPTQSVSVKIPAEFDKIYAGYNEIQKAQGFDFQNTKTRSLKDILTPSKTTRATKARCMPIYLYTEARLSVGIFARLMRRALFTDLKKRR